MKLPLKIALIGLVSVSVLSVLILLLNDSKAKGPEYLLAIGIGCLIGGIVSLVLAIAFFIAKSKTLGQGFLLTTGLLLLVGFATCTSGLLFSF